MHGGSTQLPFEPNDYLQQTYLTKGMSIIRSTEISLSELVKESNLILQVKFIESFKETVPIIDRSKDQTGKPIPPFIKKGCVFQVQGVLKNMDRITVPEKIHVPNEGWRRSLSQHKEAHAGGKSKSYNVPTYVTEVSSLQKAAILFLHHFQGMYDLTARDSFEDVAAEEKIKLLLDAEPTQITSSVTRKRH
jgi:hypothetical protein